MSRSRASWCRSVEVIKSRYMLSWTVTPVYHVRIKAFSVRTNLQFIDFEEASGLFFKIFIGGQVKELESNKKLNR
jgi:hypothetical protein